MRAGSGKREGHSPDVKFAMSPTDAQGPRRFLAAKRGIVLPPFPMKRHSPYGVCQAVEGSSPVLLRIGLYSGLVQFFKNGSERFDGTAWL